MYTSIFLYLHKIKLEFNFQKAPREYTVLKMHFQKKKKKG